MIEHDEAARIARTVLELRQRRAEHLPAEILGDQAWGILLVMFVADAASEPLTSDETFKRAGTCNRAGPRWMKALEKVGLVGCSVPSDDGDLVSLTPHGIHAIEACMEDAKTMLSTQPYVHRDVQ